jgi:uncharacterized integral membrane protein
MGTQDAVRATSVAVPVPDAAGVSVPGTTHAPSGLVKVGSTRASRAWIRLLPAAVVLAAILMFVLQNSTRTTVRFAVVSGRIPLAVALLASVALGGLLVLALGSIRILQLRRIIHRSSRTGS